MARLLVDCMHVSGVWFFTVHSYYLSVKRAREWGSVRVSEDLYPGQSMLGVEAENTWYKHEYRLGSVVL